MLFGFLRVVCVVRRTADDRCNKDEGAHEPAPWPSALEGPRLFVASCVRPLCMVGGLSQYARTACAGFIDLLQGDSAHADADGGARE